MSQITNHKISASTFSHVGSSGRQSKVELCQPDQIPAGNVLAKEHCRTLENEHLSSSTTRIQRLYKII